jgi:cation diffusion facilitator CzcD-associated flavoprotein CzcO
MSGSAQFDVIIIGGGVSGIGAACQLRMKMPHLSFVILESRASLGGTWDHYKYPGVRTDSDMYTMAYSFNPWRDNKTTASAGAVNAYLANTANMFDIEKQVRFNERVHKIRWSSASSSWTVDTERTDGTKDHIVGSFIFMSTGYTNFNHIHNPDFKDVDRFRGRVVHPQNWPTDLDHKDKEVLVIGSGATAVTIVPALAQTAKHVTMLQRSPTYILQMPNLDPVAHFCAAYLPFRVGNFIMRCKNIFEQQIVYIISKYCNTTLKNLLISDLKRKLPADCDIKRHFTPSYPVLTQRLCLSPDTDFTDAISKHGASVVTDTIERFTETGVLLTSGTQLDADIVVTATGFDLYALGGIEIEVDGKLMENACTSCVYKGEQHRVLDYLDIICVQCMMHIRRRRYCCLSCAH